MQIASCELPDILRMRLKVFAIFVLVGYLVLIVYPAYLYVYTKY